MKRIKIKDILKVLDKFNFKKYKIIVGIARRGLPFATILALKYDLPLGVVIFENKEKFLISDNVFKYNENEILFVDDVYAEGRTFNSIRKKFKNSDFLVIVKDKYSRERKGLKFLFEEKRWVYFDWEERKKVREKDRGLFRDRSSIYGK